MDSSTTPGMNGTHLQHQYHGDSSFSNFINDMEAYASNDGISGNDDYSTFPWDPALFAGNESTSGYVQQPQQQQQQQQSQPMQANLNQTLTRQSNSPALQPQHPSHTPYPPQPNYTHSLYEHRNMGQPSFDDRFMSRPSASPTSFDQHQVYQQMPYGNYGFQQQYPRQSSPPNPYYQSRPVQRPIQPSPQPMPINVHAQSQLSQTPQMDNMQVHRFPQAQQRSTHAFINPSMINTSQMVAMNGTQQQNTDVQQRQQYQPPPYFQKPGSTVDPQVLQPLQMQNYPPMPGAASQVMQQSSAPQQGQFQSQFLSTPTTLQQGPASAFVTQAKVPKDPSAPKKTKAKTSKPKKDSTADVESSDDLEIEDEPPEVKPALLVVSAPTDEKGKALYNAVEAVWYPRNKSPQAEDVRKGIAAFGETVRFLRDAWKAKNDSLKKAELPNSDTAAEAPHLKEEVAHYRQTMESVISRSLQYGHDAIVRRLGENQFTLSALYSFLLDRTNDMDFESTLVSSIFKFAVKFETLDEEMLEQVKWPKVLQRWAKKATNESKGHAQKILANAQAQSARKRAAKAEAVPGSPSSVNGTKKDLVAGVKRARDGDNIAAPAPKKIVKPASKPLALQSAERRKALEKEGLQKAQLSKADKGAVNTSSTVASRPKVTMTAPSKSSVFAGLLSASKKPGTSNAEKAAAAAAAAKDNPPTPSVNISSSGPAPNTKKEDTKKESPPRTLGPNTTKSASSFLGFLADMDKPKETETRKTEMDPNETEEQRTKRLRKESRKKLRVTWKPDNDLVQVKMFTHDPEEETGQTDNMMRDAGDTMKEGEMLKRHMALEDEDEDDEEEAAIDDFGEYSPPSEIDFSVIDSERAANFLKFGGSLKPESTASETQASYEENTLMTTYTFKSDRPETPKELPSVNDDDDFQPVVDFGEPGDQVRSREREIIARKQPQVPQIPQAGGTDLAAQLRALGMQQPQPQQQPAASFSSYNQPPATQMAIPQIPGNLDLSKLLAVMQQAKQMQQPQPQQPSYQPSAVGVAPNVAAILAQVSGQQTQSLPLGNAGNPNPFPGNDDSSRKHARNDDSADQSNKKKKKATGSDGKPYNYKTITCSFWVEGKCTKGDSCTYKHEL